MPVELPSFVGVTNVAELAVRREQCNNVIARAVRSGDLTTSDARTLTSICTRTYDRLFRFLRNR